MAEIKTVKILRNPETNSPTFNSGSRGEFLAGIGSVESVDTSKLETIVKSNNVTNVNWDSDSANITLKDGTLIVTKEIGRKDGTYHVTWVPNGKIHTSGGQWIKVNDKGTILDSGNNDKTEEGQRKYSSSDAIIKLLQEKIDKAFCKVE